MYLIDANALVNILLSVSHRGYKIMQNMLLMITMEDL